MRRLNKSSTRDDEGVMKCQSSTQDPEMRSDPNVSSWGLSQTWFTVNVL